MEAHPAPQSLALREEGPPRTSPLATIIPVVALLGLLAYLGYVLTREGDPALLYQIGVVIALLVYVLTFANVVLGMAVLIACIGLSPELSMGGIGNLRLEDFVVPALAAAWLTRTVKTREAFAPGRMRGPMLAYLACMAFSSALGILEGATNPLTSALYFGKYVEYFLIFLIAANNVKTEREFKALVLFTLMIGVAGGFMGAVRFEGVEQAPQTRLHGPLGETATIFGGYLLLNLLLAAGLYLNSRTLGHRAAAATTASLLGVGVLYTFSRTTYAALVAGLAIFAALKHRRLLIIVVLLLVAFPLIAPDPIWQRAATISTVITDSGPESWASRVYAWKTALEKLSTGGALLGSGLGSVNLGDIDNEYVRVACDLGILGLGVFLWFLYRLGRVANEAHEALPAGAFHKGFTAGYLMGLFGLAVHAIGATSFTSIRTMEHFMLLSGLMVCLANNREAWMEEAALRGEPWPAEEPLPSPV